MIIADSGFWVALASRTDRHHERARAIFAQLDEPLISTWLVLAEASHLLLKFVGARAQESLIEFYAGGGLDVFELERDHAQRMLSLLRAYADLPMDLADASLVILAEHLGSGRILSTDQRDFRAYRWKNRKPFENLLLPD